jgi:hypothetical protein
MKPFDKAALLVGKIGFAKVRVSLVLLTVAVCAFFLAKGTTKLIALLLIVPSSFPTKVSAQNDQAKPSGYPGSESPDANEILQRNIFDSKTGPLWPPPAPSDLEGDVKPLKENPVPGPDDPPPECDKELFLAATAYFPNNPNRSMVALDGPTEVDTQPLYRQGTEIGEFELVAIYPDVAYLKRPAGDYCSLKLYSERRRKKIKQRKSRRAKMIERTKKRMLKRKK